MWRDFQQNLSLRKVPASITNSVLAIYLVREMTWAKTRRKHSLKKEVDIFFFFNKSGDGGGGDMFLVILFKFALRQSKSVVLT